MEAWLRRTPAALAAWLEWSGPRRRARVALGLGAVLLALAAGAWLGAGDGPAALVLLSHPFVVAALAAAFGVPTAAARRARRHAVRTRDWTGALPVAPRDARRAAWLHAAAASIVANEIATACVVGLCGGLMTSAGTAAATLAHGAGAAAPGRGAIAALGGTTLLALWGGFAGGVAYALARRLGDVRPPPPGSRYVPAAVARAWRVPPSLAPLAAWPIRAAFVHAQPKAASRAMLPVLLLVPAGLSPAQAVATLSTAVLGLVLLAMLAGMRDAVRDAVAWLAPAPVRRAAVVLATARVALFATGGGLLAVVAIGWAVTA